MIVARHHDDDDDSKKEKEKFFKVGNVTRHLHGVYEVRCWR